MNNVMKFAATIGLIGTIALPSFAADAAKGKRVFARCKACHALEADKNRLGPSLHGIFGKTAGKSEGYKFSKSFVASDIVWTDETLTAFLKKPRAMFAKTKMAFPGIKKDQQIADLLAYLHEQLD